MQASTDWVPPFIFYLLLGLQTLASALTSVDSLNTIGRVCSLHDGNNQLCKTQRAVELDLTWPRDR